MPFDAPLSGSHFQPQKKSPLRITQVVLPQDAQPSISCNSQNSESLRQKRHRLRRIAGGLLGDERVRKCGTGRTGETVAIHRSKTGAHFVGVETCGSVWHCPVCAAKIAEQRREEVSEVIKGVQEQGGSSYMLTLTMRHDRDDKLSFLREHIVNGWRAVQNRKAYRELKAEFGIIGTVRAIEVTHGKNGWHPHLHIIFAFEGPLLEKDEKHVEETLYRLWKLALERAGGGYVSVEALDFREATASDYITKWGADRELVKGQEKLGNGSRSPWQLLADVKKCKQAGALFREYAKTFKGTRQLTWSRGLKAMFGIGDIDDMAASQAEETGEQLVLDDGLKEGRLGDLDKGTWNAVLRLKITASLLDAAHERGWPGVCDVLSRHGLGTYYDDSFHWRQPPQGVQPANPKRYIKFTRKEFLEHVEAARKPAKDS